MIDWTKPLESMNAAELRAAIRSGQLNPMARRAAERLLRQREANGLKVQEQQNRATKRAREKWTQVKHTEIGGNVRVASVVNSSKNALWGSGGLITLATFDKAIEIYDKLHERGLLPKEPLQGLIAVLRELSFTDEEIVYICAGGIIIGLVSLGYKAIKYYER